MVISCCDCEIRELGCHIRCDKYKEYKSSLSKINNSKSKESLLNSYVAEAKVRMGGSVK